jgi:CheY-like chemotaxis protein
MDIRMPVLDGIEAMRQIVAAQPPAPPASSGRSASATGCRR